MAEDDEPSVVVIVFDTGPLITLAAADALDYLRLPDAPVYIPDAVFYEATRKADALGAQSIREWVNENIEAVRIVPTELYSNAQDVLAEPPSARQRALLKDMGERAVFEFIDRHLGKAPPNDRAMVVVEDTNAARLGRAEPRVIVASTTDFLNALELEGRINSAEEIIRRAEDAGRYIAHQRRLIEEREEHERSMEAVRRVMAAQDRRRRDPGRDR